MSPLLQPEDSSDFSLVQRARVNGSEAPHFVARQGPARIIDALLSKIGSVVLASALVVTCAGSV